MIIHKIPIINISNRMKDILLKVNSWVQMTTKVIIVTQSHIRIKNHLTAHKVQNQNLLRCLLRQLVLKFV